MARIDTFGHFLTDVATAIRNKTGKSETIACEDFDTEIESISGGGGQKNRLPDEYQEVEYIQSSGTQYFITDHYANGNSQYKFKFSEGSTNGVVFGAYNSNWTTGSGFYHNSTTNEYEYVHYYSNNYLSSLRGSYLNAYDIYIDKGNVYSNGVLIQSGSTKTFTLNYPTYILAGNWVGSRAEQPLSCKLYYFQIFVDGIKLHDYIPCYRKVDGVIGMYDLVEDEFITNAGTGTFEKGPNHDTPIANLQDKEITITENTTTEITADDDYDGLGTVSVITNVSSSSNTPIFSTTEVVVGTWIDDKPLYMKTLTGNITAGTSGAFDETIQTNITDSLNTLFIGNNSFMTGTDGTSYPVNYVTIPSGNTVYLIKTAPSVTNKTVRAFSYGNVFSANELINYTINLFYTKKSDSVISDVSTIGGMNYSTSEHVVKDDGVNPIVYEKTITTSTTGYQNNHPVNKSFAHNISNVDKIWISEGSYCYSGGQTSKYMYPVIYLNYHSDLYRQHLHANVNKTNINVYVGDWVIAQGTIYHYVTLRYTKNTA